MSLQRLIGEKNVEETQHSQKKTGIDTKIQEFSAMSPTDCPQESLLSHQKFHFVTAAKPVGQGEGWDQLNPNILRGSPFPGIQQTSLHLKIFPFWSQNWRISMHQTGRGNVENCNRVKENVKKEFNRYSLRLQGKSRCSGEL